MHTTQESLVPNANTNTTLTGNSAEQVRRRVERRQWLRHVIIFFALVVAIGTMVSAVIKPDETAGSSPLKFIVTALMIVACFREALNVLCCRWYEYAQGYADSAVRPAAATVRVQYFD
jgi:hypothetical protein